MNGDSSHTRSMAFRAMLLRKFMEPVILSGGQWDPGRVRVEAMQRYALAVSAGDALHLLKWTATDRPEAAGISDDGLVLHVKGLWTPALDASDADWSVFLFGRWAEWQMHRDEKDGFDIPLMEYMGTTEDEWAKFLEKGVVARRVRRCWGEEKK